MTIEDYCISLNPNNFFLVVLGVVDMCHDLLSLSRQIGRISDGVFSAELFAHILAVPLSMFAIISTKIKPKCLFGIVIRIWATKT